MADVKRIAELMEARKPGEEILRVEDLVVHYKIRAGWVRAVEGAKFTLNRGDTMGLVGESGCGKTTTGYSIAQLLPDNAYIKGGKIHFLGEEILSKTLLPDGRVDKFNEYMRKLRWKRISYIFQGAMNALNPVLKVGDQIVEAILAHEKVDEETARERVKELYKLVGIPPDRIDNYPHEYSGGMKQRAMIAMALALNPDLIIADEPTTALDVIVQDKILGEMTRLQRELGMTMIIITHDISIVAEIANKMSVMYAGQIVERGTTRHIFKRFAHPYTKGLLGSFPSIVGEKRRLEAIPGSPPNLLNPPSGCRFHPRCPYAQEICRTEEPPEVEVEPGHFVKCHFAEKFFKEWHGG